ncbi:MAG: hepHag family protein [Parcubacteria group bacterium Gr01-1014_56]|nr:MAG: hepHag family protein [Parcubacteria group bacterium Gr01-1014_56]
MTTTKRLTAQFLILTVAFAFALSVNYLHAWTSPPANPPNNNVAAPINEGTTSQTKNGILGVNALAVFGDLILSGSTNYLNFGTVAGSAGYGIRNNSGTLEYKNSGGSWGASSASFPSTVSSLEVTNTLTAGTVRIGSQQVYVCSGATPPRSPGYDTLTSSSCDGNLTPRSQCSSQYVTKNGGVYSVSASCIPLNLFVNYP